MSVLDEILQQKRVEINAAQGLCCEDDLFKLALNSAKPRGFRNALKSSPRPAVIAEIKRASPSLGLIRPDLDPEKVASEYAQAGAACISVLTDEKYFQGHLDYLAKVRSAAPNVPILRKDFVIDRYQVWQSRAAGADAILLIVSALSDFQLKELHRSAAIVELDVVIEVHSLEELQRVVKLILLDYFDDKSKTVRTSNLPMLGVNSRDLKTFTKSSAVFTELANALPELLASSQLQGLQTELLLVAESGLKSSSDILPLDMAGYKAFLIAESLVASGNPGENLKTLLQETRKCLK